MVTKQQQLEWLAKNLAKWPVGIPEIGMSKKIAGVVSTIGDCHMITIAEWQQERDKMQNQADQPAQDNSWHERGEFPPFHTAIEWDPWGDGSWVETKILADIGDGEFVMIVKGAKTIVGMPANFRPLRTEREKAIDAALSVLPAGGVDTKRIIEMLYDAGLLKEAK